MPALTPGRVRSQHGLAERLNLHLPARYEARTLKSQVEAPDPGEEAAVGQNPDSRLTIPDSHRFFQDAARFWRDGGNF